MNRHYAGNHSFLALLFLLLRMSFGWSPRPIPSTLLVIGYAHNTEKVTQAIQDGVNVVCWSFIDMVDGKDKPTFSTDLNLQEIQNIREAFPDVLHVAAIGGWNGPHPCIQYTGTEWCEAFVTFNQENNHIFDGIDWDLEGHDDRSAPTSAFTIEVLDIMADFSLRAKAVYNMSVSMAPAESYLDANDGDLEFSLKLNLPPLAWMNNPKDRKVVESANFRHAGRQCYAYVLQKAGVQSFDWISIQLYEAYCRYLHETTRGGVTPTQALLQRAQTYQNGYLINNVPHYGETTVKFLLHKLVFGIANGWADGHKFVRVDPDDLTTVQSRLMEQYQTGYRGVMFWTIDEEGTNGVHMSKSLSKLQQVGYSRKSQKEEYREL